MATTIMAMALVMNVQTATQAAKNPMRGSLYWEKRSQGLAVYSVDTAKKDMAITFDDGPHPYYTSDILALLDEFQAKATFFVVGEYAERFPQLVRTMIAKGHEVGNHTFTHPQVSAMTATEVRACDAVIMKATGQRAVLLRPPGGRISDQTLRVARQTQHRLILWTWDVDTRDWAEPGVQKIVEVVVHHADPGDIVLFHDGGGNRKQTVLALRIILSQLSQEGYHFVTVSQLLKEQTIRPQVQPNPLLPLMPEARPPKE